MTIEAVRTPPTAGRSARAASRGGPDRLSIALFSLALLMILIALLAHQFGTGGAAKAAPRVTLIRKVYRTRVIETIIAPGPSSAPTVSQSVASSGAVASAPLVTTHTS